MGSKPGRPPNSTTRHGRGSGYGGEAKGAGRGNPGWHVDRSVRIGGAKPHDPKIKARAEARRLSEAERNENLYVELYSIGMAGALERDRIVAIVGYLNRKEGTPVSRQVNLNQDVSNKTDAELLADVARLAAAIGIGALGPDRDSRSEGAAGPADLVPDRA